MLETRTLARPYAKAIFEIASQFKTYEKWSQVLAILALVVEDPRIEALLRDKTIFWQDMSDLFLSICETVLDDFSRNLILILALHKRLEVLAEIKSLYEEMRHDKENTMDVQLVSSIALAEDQKMKFKTLLEQYFSKTAKMHFRTDQNLVGGFIATTGNDVIDGSIQGQLTNLKEVLGDTI